MPSKQQETYDVVVVGAGLAGLTLAWRLQEKGLAVLILEKSSMPGGVISSKNSKGFFIEEGPNTAVLKSELRCLIHDLDLEQEVIFSSTTAKKRYIASNKKNGQTKLESVSFNPMNLISSPLLSAAAKLRLLGAVVPRRLNKVYDESVQRFMTRHFGLEFTNQVVAAGMNGIWAGDITRLSARECLPTLWQMQQESGSLFLGLAKKLSASRKKNKEKPRIFTFKSGLQFLTDSLAKKIKHLEFSSQVESCEKTSSGLWEVNIGEKSLQAKRSVLCKELVITTPQKAAAQLVRPLAAQIAETIEKIPSSSVGIVHFSWDKSEVNHSLNGFGCLIPPREGRPILGAIFSSSLFPDRAPQDKHLLTCFTGGALNPEFANVNSQTVRKQIGEELAKLVGARTKAQEIDWREWKDGIPNYPIGHFATVQAIKKLEKEFSGIHFLGSWLEGISLNARIVYAEKLAIKIIDTFKSCP